MGGEQSHTSGCPVTMDEVFPKSAVVPNFSCFICLQKGFLQSYADWMVVVNKVAQVRNVLFEAMAVPREKGQCEKGERREKEKN